MCGLDSTVRASIYNVAVQGRAVGRLDRPFAVISLECRGRSQAGASLEGARFIPYSTATHNLRRTLPRPPTGAFSRYKADE